MFLFEKQGREKFMISKRGREKLKTRQGKINMCHTRQDKINFLSYKCRVGKFDFFSNGWRNKFFIFNQGRFCFVSSQ